jgi:hypothetical protein
LIGVNSEVDLRTEIVAKSRGPTALTFLLDDPFPYSRGAL